MMDTNELRNLETGDKFTVEADEDVRTVKGWEIHNGENHLIYELCESEIIVPFTKAMAKTTKFGWELVEEDELATDGGRSLGDPERTDAWECDECERETGTVTYETARGVRWFQCTECGALKDLFGDVEFEDDENAGKELVTDGGEDESAEFVSAPEARMAGLEVGAVFGNDDHYRLEITDRTPGGCLIYEEYDDHGSRIETVGGSVRAIEGKLDIDGYERVEDRGARAVEDMPDPVFWQRVALEAIHNDRPAKALSMRIGEHFEDSTGRVYSWGAMRVDGVNQRTLDEWLASAEFEATTESRERGIMITDIEYTDFRRMQQ